MKILSLNFFAATMALVLAGDALASRARVLVMGSGDPSDRILESFGSDGSFYYQDDYNIFYNPALATHANNWVIVEKSNAPGNTSQGGFLIAENNWRYGAYFNRVAPIFGHNKMERLRPVEVILANKISDELSAGGILSYGSFYKAGKKQSDLALRLGVEYGAWEPFGMYKILGSDDVTNPAYTNKQWIVGLKYKWGAWTAYTAYRWLKYDQNDTITEDFESDSVGIGATKKFDVHERTSIYLGTGFWRRTTADHNMIPVNISAEIKMAKEFALRAGLGFLALDRLNEDTLEDRTSGRVGATLTYDNFDFDWVIGARIKGGQDPNNMAHLEDLGDTSSQNFGFTQDFFSAASLSYRW